MLAFSSPRGCGISERVLDTFERSPLRDCETAFNSFYAFVLKHVLCVCVCVCVSGHRRPLEWDASALAVKDALEELEVWAPASHATFGELCRLPGKG